MFGNHRNLALTSESLFAMKKKTWKTKQNNPTNQQQLHQITIICVMSIYLCQFVVQYSLGKSYANYCHHIWTVDCRRGRQYPNTIHRPTSIYATMELGTCTTAVRCTSGKSIACEHVPNGSWAVAIRSVRKWICAYRAYKQTPWMMSAGVTMQPIIYVITTPMTVVV